MVFHEVFDLSGDDRESKLRLLQKELPRYEKAASLPMMASPKLVFKATFDNTAAPIRPIYFPLTLSSLRMLQELVERSLRNEPADVETNELQEMGSDKVLEYNFKYLLSVEISYMSYVKSVARNHDPRTAPLPVPTPPPPPPSEPASRAMSPDTYMAYLATLPSPESPIITFDDTEKEKESDVLPWQVPLSQSVSDSISSPEELVLSPQHKVDDEDTSNALTNPMPSPKRVRIDPQAPVDIVSLDEVSQEDSQPPVYQDDDDQMGHLSQVPSPRTEAEHERMHLEAWQQVDFSSGLNSNSQRFSDRGLFGGQFDDATMPLPPSNLLQAHPQSPMDTPTRALGPVSFVSAQPTNHRSAPESFASGPVQDHGFSSIGALPQPVGPMFVDSTLPLPPPPSLAPLLSQSGGRQSDRGLSWHSVAPASFTSFPQRPNITMEVVEHGIIGGRAKPYRKRGRAEPVAVVDGETLPRNVRPPVKPPQTKEEKAAARKAMFALKPTQRVYKDLPNYAGFRQTQSGRLFPYVFLNESIYEVMQEEFVRWQITKDVVLTDTPEGFQAHPMLKDNCFVYALKQAALSWENDADKALWEKALGPLNFNVNVSFTSIKNFCLEYFNVSKREVLFEIVDYSNPLAKKRGTRFICKQGQKNQRPDGAFAVTVRLCRVENHYCICEEVTDRAKLALFGIDRRTSANNGCLLAKALKNGMVKNVTFNDPGVMLGAARSWLKVTTIEPVTYPAEAFAPGRPLECLPFIPREDKVESASSGKKAKMDPIDVANGLGPEDMAGPEDLAMLAEVLGETSLLLESLPEEGDARKKKEELSYAHLDSDEDKQAWFGDFETFISPDDPKHRHQVYCCACCSWDEQHKEVFYGPYCFDNMLAYIHRHIPSSRKYMSIGIRPKFRPTIYFHNLSFDVCFALERTFCIFNVVEKGNKMLQMDGLAMGRTLLPFRLKDTWGILRCRLDQTIGFYWPPTEQAAAKADFGKDIFPYKTLTNASQKMYPMETCVSDLKIEGKKDVDVELFKQQAAPFINEAGDQVDLQAYCGKYCIDDCRLLCRAWKKARMLNQDGMESLISKPDGTTETVMIKPPYSYDINNLLTIPAIAYKYFLEKCYYNTSPEGKCIYGFHSSLRAFEQLSVRGGRCMPRDNESWALEGEGHLFKDFDAASLYPSAVKRLYCFWEAPVRLPEEFRGADASRLLGCTCHEDESTSDQPFMSFDGFTVACKIKEMRIKRHFPILCYKDKEGCHWTNEARPDEVLVMNEIDLRNLIDFHEASIEVIDGYVWNQGKDFSCRQAIQDLYDCRVNAKKVGNPVQMVVKLIMNSAYGKSVLKFVPKQKDYVTEKLLEPFLAKHAASVTSYYPLGLNPDNARLWCVESVAEYFDSFNKGHPDMYPNWWGARILSMSKRIMCEVMCLAEDIGVPIYYTDTDSMVLDDAGGQLQRLATAFQDKYGRVLLGGQMGQFQSDFEAPGLDKNSINGTEAIFVAKKIYCIKLQDKDGNTALHKRMKGIPAAAIDAHHGKELENVWRLYQELFASNEVDPEHGPIPIELCAGGKVLFDMTKTKMAFKKESMIRKIMNKNLMRHHGLDKTVRIDLQAQSKTMTTETESGSHTETEFFGPQTKVHIEEDGRSHSVTFNN